MNYEGSFSYSNECVNRNPPALALWTCRMQGSRCRVFTPEGVKELVGSAPVRCGKQLESDLLRFLEREERKKEMGWRWRGHLD